MLSFKKFISESYEERDRYNQKKLSSVLNPNPDENKHFEITKHIVTLHSKGVKYVNAWNDAVEKFGENGRISGYPKDIGIRLHYHPDYKTFKDAHGIQDYEKPEPVKKKTFDYKQPWVKETISNYLKNTNNPSKRGVYDTVLAHPKFPEEHVLPVSLSAGNYNVNKWLSHHGIEIPEKIKKPIPEPNPKPKQISDDEFMKTHSEMGELSYSKRAEQMNRIHGTSMSSGSYQKRFKRISGNN